MRTYTRGTGALVCCVLLALTAVAQRSAAATGASKSLAASQGGSATPSQGDSLSGKFEGTATSSSIGELAITLELLNQAGKISGKLESPHGVGMIKEGTYEAGKVAIKFDFAGDEGVITGQLKGDSITGEWSVGGVGGTLALKRVATASAPTTATAPATAGIIDISGEWNATADANGEPFLFSLKLKLDGEKVSGESTSSMGTTSVKGSWVKGTLTATLETPTGSTSLTATLRDGKLVGEFDYAHQFQGKWSAVKK